MKFLCLACDEQMQLAEARPPDDGGSIAASFRCPRCGQGVAMLTNAHETEVVRSLGVKLGANREGRCPFGAMTAEAPVGSEREGGLAWTAGALERLERIPEMIRPLARDGIERFARSAGRGVVDEAILDEARAGILG